MESHKAENEVDEADATNKHVWLVLCATHRVVRIEVHQKLSIFAPRFQRYLEPPSRRNAALYRGCPSSGSL
eukprot:m.95048 g.95048  ORF g.95048 m.95048 type:complete len:71 (-) comp13881_c2_seq5:3294-3506(-)